MTLVQHSPLEAKPHVPHCAANLCSESDGFGTFGTDSIPAEAKVLQGREVGQVGPQRLGTFGTDCIVSEVKALEGHELGEVGPQ